MVKNYLVTLLVNFYGCPGSEIASQPTAKNRKRQKMLGVNTRSFGSSPASTIEPCCGHYAIATIFVLSKN